MVGCLSVPGGKSVRHGGFLALLLLAVLATLIVWPVTARAQQTFGANLSRPSNWGLSCDWYPAAGVGPFTFNSTPSCTWSFVDDPTNPGEGLAVPGTGTVTKVRVKTGARSPFVYPGITYPAGPMRVEVLRARRSPYVPPGSNVGDAVCCDVVGESQIFTPAPTGITEVNVNLPVTNELITGIENVDILGLTVFPGGQVPGHDTFNYNAGEGPTAGIFYPHVNLGEENRSFGGVGGVQLLMNADWVPAQGGGGGGGGNEFTIGGPKGLRLPVTVPGPGLVGVRDVKDTVSNSLRVQAMHDAGQKLPLKAKLGLKPTSVTATAAETVFVKLKLVGKAKKKYKQGKKAKVGAAVSFTPNGGSTETQTLNLKLKK